MHPSLLPPALLDLISSARSNSFNLMATAKARSGLRAALNPRYMHQAALATAMPQHAADVGEASQAMYSRRKVRRRRDGALTARASERQKTPVSELERRVQALRSTAVHEVSIRNLPGFSEEDLVNIYQDLLALPVVDAQESNSDSNMSQAEEDQTVLDAVNERLLYAAPNMVNSLSPVAASMRQRQDAIRTTSPVASVEATEHDTFSHYNQPYRRIISRLRIINFRLEAVRSTVDSATDKTTSQKDLPISVLTNHEWSCLVRTCLREQDGDAAEQVVGLMKRYRVSTSEEPLNDILEFYANQGDISRTEAFMTNFLTEPPTDRQRDLHVKSHLRACPPKTIPHSALSILHKYELQPIPAPVQSYTRLITALFSVQSSICYAQAWDLFAHMRYVAHPTPDALLYTLMIRACASSLISSSEPERALDLWTEMTVDHEIQPLAGTYTAIILACARSGSKAYIHEAFRLAKEMLDSHRDASGRSAFKPDGKTFSALLEGAKRIGDLARTRWILAEMVRGSHRDEDNGFVNAEVTEEVMMHVLHAYAAYKVPFNRAAALLVNDTPSQASTGSKSDPQTSSVAEPLPDKKAQNVPTHITTPSFSHLPPQSRSEVISEVRTLFNRILDDISMDGSHHGDAPPFSKVKLTPRLLNSYLSVHYAHAPFEDARELFKTIFAEHGVPRNVRSYIEALERCAKARRGQERTAALEFAEELWVQWQDLENGEHSKNTVWARMVERANVAMIRIWTLVGDLDRAMDQIKTFARRYAPLNTRRPAPKLPLQSTRTVLHALRPLVRMTSTTELPDDTVPPLLTFGDVEILHHRLVAAGRTDDIGYIKYVCKAYEGALRVRRDLTMRAEPAQEKPPG